MLEKLYKKIRKDMKKAGLGDFAVESYINELRANDIQLADDLAKLQKRYKLKYPSVDLLRSIKFTELKDNFDYFIDLHNRSIPQPWYSFIDGIRKVLEKNNSFDEVDFRNLLKKMNHFNSYPMSTHFQNISQEYSSLYANPKYAKEYLELIKSLKEFPFDRVFLVDNLHKLGKKYRSEALEIIRQDISVNCSLLLTVIKRLKLTELLPDIKSFLAKNYDCYTKKELRGDVRKLVEKTIDYLEEYRKKQDKK